MPEAVRTCPLCQASHHHIFERTVFRGTEVINKICEYCGFVFQSPRQTQAELKNFYAKEYRRLYQGKEGPTQKDLFIQEKRANVLVEFTRSVNIDFHRHLDVGCSAGILLKVFQNNFNSYPVGIEPGDVYRDHARSKGITVFMDLDEVKSGEEQPFDFISMAHVLEHLPDPVGYLSQLRENYLTFDGYLLVEVPNLYAHDCFEPAHLSGFSEHTLKETLKKSGFNIVSVKVHGAPRSLLLPLYLTVAAQSSGSPTVQPVVPERLVKIKRKYGILRRKMIQRLFPQKAWIQV
jgi:hypothetical protein